MYHEEFSAAGEAAVTKIGFLKKNPLGYFVASALAGIFVGLGILLAYTVGGLLTGQPYAKVVMGASFSIALSLVVMAGAELFTGNNLVMAAGFFCGRIRATDAVKLWAMCYFGNWFGALFISVTFVGAGFISEQNAAVSAFIAEAAALKMSLSPTELLFRGILCNVIVCLAVWCANYRMKSESGKLIIIFWCLMAIIVCGYEHCVVNMTALTVSLFAQNYTALDINAAGYLYNMGISTLGNILGGVLFVALPYAIISRK